MTRAGGKPGAPSICWKCARAGGGLGCPWVDDNRAVPGWQAKERVLRNSHGRGKLITSRVKVVLTCPLFVADGKLAAQKSRTENRPQHSSLQSMCRWGGLTPKAKK